MQKVIHLTLKSLDPRSGRREFFFGSKAAIFDYFTSEDIGICYATLRQHNISSKPYENSRCRIHQGELITKKGGRGRR